MTKSVQALVAVAAAMVILVGGIWLAKQRAEHDREKAIARDECISVLEAIEASIGKSTADFSKSRDLSNALRDAASQLKSKYTGTEWAPIAADIDSLAGVAASSFSYRSTREFSLSLGVRPPPPEPGSPSDAEDEAFIQERVEKLKKKIYSL